MQLFAAAASGVLLVASLYTPGMMGIPVTPAALRAISCGVCGGLGWVAAGILFYIRRWCWALLLLVLGYGLMAYSHSVTSPLAG